MRYLVFEITVHSLLLHLNAVSPFLPIVADLMYKNLSITWNPSLSSHMQKPHRCSE